MQTGSGPEDTSLGLMSDVSSDSDLPIKLSGVFLFGVLEFLPL